MLITATYDAYTKSLQLKFYDETCDKIVVWNDNTDYMPYVLSKMSLAQAQREITRSDVTLSEETRRDLLADCEIKVVKISADNIFPLIGQDGVRNQTEVWESDLRAYESYLLDKRLICGCFYQVTPSTLTPIKFEAPPEVLAMLEKAIKDAPANRKAAIAEWASNLNQPLIDFKRAAIDIETASQIDRFPDSSKAEYPVIGASLVGKNFKKLYLLKRKGIPLGKKPKDCLVLLFSDERKMLEAIFTDMKLFPFIVSFNGDDFDFPYLLNRAILLGIPRAEIPITTSNNFTGLREGIHLDLYKTFSNKSLQTYAFNSKYTEKSLNAISEGLLGKSKIEFEGAVWNLPIYEMGAYNLHDTELTYELTTFNDNILMKLLTIIGRISKMPIDDASRLGASSWIRQMLFFEHRRENALIPRPEDLQAKGGAHSAAIIKGKKFKGGQVIEPKSGIHFNVSVLDFASLYPSIIKVYNVSYETIDCIHSECKANKIPDVEGWYCSKNTGIESLVVGSLRDLRVEYYKHLAKSKTLDALNRETYKTISQALKVLMNASYGVLGFEAFALYCLPAAEAITALGRFAINSGIEQSRLLGVEVLASDTDSMFLDKPTPEQVKLIQEWTHEHLGIDIEVDKVYRYVALSNRKKNYFGVLEDGTVDLKGLTGKKSQTPQFIKDSFAYVTDVLKEVRVPADFTVAKQKIKVRLLDDITNLKARKLPMDSLAFRMMMGKAPSAYTDTLPQHVKAAQELQHEGVVIQMGDIVSFVKTKHGPIPVKLLKDQKDLDVSKYMEYIQNVFDQLLGSLGWSLDQLQGATSLDDFFG